MSLIGGVDDPEQEWIPNVAEPVTWDVSGGSVESFSLADSPATSTVSEAITPMKFLRSEDQVSFQTVHGTYTVILSSPFSLLLSSDDGTPLVSESYFTLRAGTDVLVPCNGIVVDMHDRGFTAVYDVALPNALEPVVIGSMELNVAYGSSQVPKITATVIEVDETASSWQVIWNIAPSDEFEVFVRSLEGRGGKIGSKLGSLESKIGASLSKLTGKSALSLTKGEKLFGTWMARVESDIALGSSSTSSWMRSLAITVSENKASWTQLAKWGAETLGMAAISEAGRHYTESHTTLPIYGG